MLYTFRIDRTQRAAILTRLTDDHTLSQGWGGGPETRFDLREQGFRDAVRGFYQLATTRIPSNLLRIRDLKDGDILVTPHLPSEGKVSIHVVAGDFPDCYDCVIGDSTHQNHRIRVAQSYGLNGQISASNDILAAWKGKLPWMRLPVYPAGRFETAFVSVINALEADPSASLGASDLEDFINRLRVQLVSLIERELQLIASSGGGISFERVCEHLLRGNGYMIRRHNQYDRAGGDADLECVRDRQEASPL